MTWKSFDIPFIGDNYKSFNIATSQDKLILCLVNKLVILDESLQTIESIPIKPPYGSYTWYPSEDNYLAGWMQWHNRLYRVPNVKDIKTWVMCNMPSAWRVRVDGNHAVNFSKHGIAGIYIDPEGKEYEFDFTEHPILKSTPASSLVLKGNILHLTLRDGIRNSVIVNQSEVPQYGVLEIDLLTKKITDHTYNLDGRNATGNPLQGSCQNLTINHSKDTFYVSTEHFVYKRKLTDNSWEKIYQSCPKSKSHSLDDNSIALDTNNGLFIYKDNTLYAQEGFPTSGYILRNIIKLKDTLIAFRTEYKGSNIEVLINSPKYEKQPEPSNAQYLNIKFPENVITIGDKLLLAADNKIYNITNGNKEIIFQSVEKIFDLKQYSNDIILLAKETCLSLYNLVSKVEQILFTYDQKVTSSVVITDGQKVAIIQNKNKLIVLKSDFTIDSEFSETGTYIEDALFYQSDLYYVGFANRKRKGVPVQVPIFRGPFALWETNGEKLGADMADGRLYKIYEHAGNIYVLGESAGGNSQFRWNGLDLKTSTINNGADWWTHAVKTKANHITYVGMIDPLQQKVIRGQFVLTRLPDMEGNTHRANCLFVDESGVYIGGEAAAYIFNRDIIGLLNQKPAEYRGDASLLKLRTDLTGGRLNWFTPGNGKVKAYTDKYALISTDNGGDLITNKGTCDKSITNNTYLISW